MNKVRRAIIVTAAIAPTVRQLAAALPAGMDMFVAAHSPTGAPPATHYASDGLFEEQFAAALSDPQTLVDTLAAAGQTLPLAAAQGLLAQAVVDEREALEVLAEMGLLPVSEGAL